MSLILSISHKSSALINGCQNGDLFSAESPRFQNNQQSYPSRTKFFLDTYHGRNFFFFNPNYSCSHKLLFSVTCRSISADQQSVHKISGSIRDIEWQITKKIKEQFKNRSEHGRNDERSKVNLNPQMALSASDIQLKK